jgi:hypothetical protein
MKPSSYLLVLIIIVSVVFGGVSLTYASIKMKLLPVIVSGLIFVLAVAELIREILANRRPVAKEPREAKDSTGETINEQMGLEDTSDIRGDMVGFAWLMGMIVSTYLVGFLVSIPLFVLIYLKTHGINWLMSSIMAVIAVAFTHIVFVKVMQVQLYDGLILEKFLS